MGAELIKAGVECWYRFGDIWGAELIKADVKCWFCFYVFHVLCIYLVALSINNL